MTNYSAVLKELMLAGYEGAALLAAFNRLCAAIGGVAPVEAAVDVSQPATPSVDRRRKSAEPDRRQLNFMLASDGGQAKAPPLSDAERQAVRRARQKNVTLRDVNARQVLENVEESRNVTEKRDEIGQAAEIVGNSAPESRDSVTRRGKKRSPHTPLRKTKPPNPPNRDLPHVTWDSPLLPFLEELHGKPFGRFGSGRTVSHAQLKAAMRLMEERSASLPLKATGS